jgi:hypothetical protein
MESERDNATYLYVIDYYFFQLCQVKLLITRREAQKRCNVVWKHLLKENWVILKLSCDIKELQWLGHQLSLAYMRSSWGLLGFRILRWLIGGFRFLCRLWLPCRLRFPRWIKRFWLLSVGLGFGSPGQFYRRFRLALLYIFIKENLSSL